MKHRRLGTECLKALTVRENTAAMAADTSSPAAASTPVVGAAAAALATLTFEPMIAKSVAAEVIISGAAITNDICSLLPGRHRPSG
jgi:hypothetical protein